MITCRECGGEVREDASPGVWLHEDTDEAEGLDIDLDHVPVPDACSACGGVCETNERGLCEGCEDDTAEDESSLGPEDEPDPAPESD